MTYTREQLEFLQHFDRMSALRDLRHMVGWEVFTHLCEQKIQILMASYIKEDASREEVWERHVKLKAVMEFWAAMREAVDHAVDFCNPEEVALAVASLSQNPDLE